MWSKWTERLAEINRTAGTFDLVPRVAGIDCGRSGVRGWAALLFGVVSGGVFIPFLGMSDGIAQRDHGRDGDDQKSYDN